MQISLRVTYRCSLAILYILGAFSIFIGAIAPNKADKAGIVSFIIGFGLVLICMGVYLQSSSTQTAKRPSAKPAKKTKQQLMREFLQESLRECKEFIYVVIFHYVLGCAIILHTAIMLQREHPVFLTIVIAMGLIPIGIGFWRHRELKREHLELTRQLAAA
jgi:hypothetical protein